MPEIPEFTKEQEAEIRRRIAEAQQVEQYRLAGDQFYRAALANMNLLVQQGVYDPYVLNVGKALYQGYKEQMFPAEPPTAEPDPEGAPVDSEDPV